MGLRRLPILTLWAFCSCSGDSKLTREECKAVDTKLAELALADLEGQGIDTAVAQNMLKRNNTGFFELCVEGGSWDRKSYECAMKAESLAAVQLCSPKKTPEKSG